MVSFINYIGLPYFIGAVIIVTFMIIQIIGELIEFSGKIVPEFMKIRKYIARKKREREILSIISENYDSIVHIPDTLDKVEKLLQSFDSHYSNDKLEQRNNWMKWVNDKAIVYDTYCSHLTDLENKLDKINDTTLSMIIDNKRSLIIDFASKVIDKKYPATREQFNRIFKTYEEYERIIEENNRTNGEVSIAIQIIDESYKERMSTHSFIEDIRGYTQTDI